MTTPTQTAVPTIFDRALLAARLARALKQGADPFLLDRAIEDLGERLQAVLRPFSSGVDIGTPQDRVRALLGERIKDLAHVAIPDDETRGIMLAPEAYDLAVSVFALHAVNDLPGFFAQARRSLKPDGLLMAAFPGGDTLTELRQSFAAAEAEIDGGLSPRIAPFADLRDVGALLQRAGFALPVTDVDRIIIRYDNAFALMRDLRSMGATNIMTERRRTPLRRATLLRMAEIYAERFADGDGRIRATFDIIWLSGWAPHENQQKPLRPGSAKASLAEAVKALSKK